MTTLPELLAAHPEAVKDIESRIANAPLNKFDDEDATTRIRRYAALNRIGNPYLDSIESLLTAITAKLKAERGLSDGEIEGMR